MQAHIAACFPHLGLRTHASAAGRSLVAARALRAGEQVLREAAFASCRPLAARGSDAALVDGLVVHVGNGSLAAALPLFLQLQPNPQALAAAAAAAERGGGGGSDSSATALALIAPAIHTNGFTMAEDLQLSVLVGSLSNHSCEPNIATSLEAAQGGGGGAPVLLFTALRDIAAGEELLHSYIDASAGLRDRQARLQQYGFVCACGACAREGLHPQ